MSLSSISKHLFDLTLLIKLPISIKRLNPKQFADSFYMEKVDKSEV